MNRAPVNPRRGFTLVELLVSMALMTVLMGGIASAMLLAVKAIPDRKTPLGAALDGFHAAEQISAELCTATSFSTAGSTIAEFVVPDRNSDGVDEVIRYVWSGTPGASLTRRYNSALPLTFVMDVHEFALTYQSISTASDEARGANESVETILISYNSRSSLADYAVESYTWPGQCFRPVLPEDATSWKVTRVRLAMKVAGGNDGVTRLQLRTEGTGNLPSTTVLEEAYAREAELSDDYVWREFSFGSVSGLSPSTGLCLVAQGIAVAPSCGLRYQSTGVIATDANLVRTSNAGSSWTSEPTQSLLFAVYGTVTASSTPAVAGLNAISAVRIRLQAGADASAVVETTAPLLNQPVSP